MTTASPSTWDRPRFTPSGAPYGDLHSGHTKEQYSVAYVHALATRARCKLQGMEVDDEQVDVTIRQKAEHLRYSRTALDVQLKCTSRDVLRDDGVHFPLSRKQYDGLRARGILATILVVLIVEEEFDDWFEVGDSDLLMRGSAFWVPMDSQPSISTDSTTVLLPITNRFNVDQLLDMLQRVGEGGTP